MQLKLLILKKILLNPMGQGGRYGLMDSDIQQMFAYSAFYLNHTHEALMVYATRGDIFHQPLQDFKFKFSESILRILPFDLDIEVGCEKGKIYRLGIK